MSNARRDHLLATAENARQALPILERMMNDARSLPRFDGGDLVTEQLLDVFRSIDALQVSAWAAIGRAQQAPPQRAEPYVLLKPAPTTPDAPLGTMVLRPGDEVPAGSWTVADPREERP